MISRIFKRRIVWNGITVEVCYEPNWMSHDDAPIAHLQVRSIDPAKAPLPITETGYISHFIDADAVTAEGGPVHFARAWLDAAATSKAWIARQEAARQYNLFP